MAITIPDAGLERIRRTMARNWVFMGDSLTVGAGSSNASYAFAQQAPAIAGRFSHKQYANAGVAGETTAQIAARLGTYLSNSSVDGIVWASGMNDQPSTSIASYVSTMEAVFQKVAARGLPMIVLTVPPRSASVATSTTRRFVMAANLWLIRNAPRYAATLVDVTSVLADPTTGDLSSTHDSGDGVHWSDRGHQRVAQAVAAAMRGLEGSTRLAAAVSVQPYNLLTNPLMAGSGTVPDNWTQYATGPTVVKSIEADTYGILTAGRWAKMTIDATTTAGSAGWQSNTVSAASGANFSDGDEMLLTGYFLFEDLITDCFDTFTTPYGTASFGVKASNASTTAGISFWTNIVDKSPGQFASTWTVPAGLTGFYIRAEGTARLGMNMAWRIGQMGAFNLTKLGIAGLFG